MVWIPSANLIHLIIMKKTKLNKNKSQAGIIVAVILILLVLSLIVIIWNILNFTTKQSSEDIATDYRLMKINMRIVKVEGLNDSIKINVSIERGAEKLDAKNQTTQTRTYNRTITIVVPVNVTRTINRTVTIANGSADIVFVIDTTGSMYSDIVAVRKIIQNFTLTLESRNITARLGLVEFKDYNVSPCGSAGDFPYKVHQFLGENFTNNLTLFNNTLNSLIATGGYDYPESSLTAVDIASKLDYNNKEIIILVTDSPPHAADCTMGAITTNYSCSSSGPQYILSGPGNIKDSLISKNIPLYYLNYGVCTNQADINLSILTGGEYYNYSASSASIEVQNIIMQIAYEINATEPVNITVTENITEEANETRSITETYTEYESENIINSLKFLIMNLTSSYTYELNQTPMPLETIT